MNEDLLYVLVVRITRRTDIIPVLLVLEINILNLWPSRFLIFHGPICRWSCCELLELHYVAGESTSLIRENVPDLS